MPRPCWPCSARTSSARPGVGVGVATLPDDALHERVRAVAGPELTRRRTDPPALTVVELMVEPVQQGQGLGHRLLDALVDGRPAWLLTHPEGAAADFYSRDGWRPPDGRRAGEADCPRRRKSPSGPPRRGPAMTVTAGPTEAAAGPSPAAMLPDQVAGVHVQAAVRPHVDPSSSVAIR